MDITSELTPNLLQPLSTTKRRPVFFTEFRIVLSSSGRSDLKSITSTLIPYFDKISAHLSASKIMYE